MPNLTNKRAFLFGGLTLLGSKFCDRLLKGGRRVWYLDNLPTSDAHNIAHLTRCLHFKSIYDVLKPVAPRMFDFRRSRSQPVYRSLPHDDSVWRGPGIRLARMHLEWGNPW